jgi:preprotein translocase subunit SecB
MPAAPLPDERGDFTLSRIYATELSYHVVVPEGEPTATPQVTCRWDWRFLDTTTVEVLLGVAVGPSAGRFEEAKASYVAVFSLPGSAAGTSLRQFVRVHAPTIMLPYLLEALSALTSRGYFGGIVLRPFDVAALIPQGEDDATGAAQIRNEPAFTDVEARLGAVEAR